MKSKELKEKKESIIKMLKEVENEFFNEMMEAKSMKEKDKALADWRRCGRAILQVKAMGVSEKEEKENN